MTDKFKVSLEKIIDEFKLETIYIHKEAKDIQIEENDEPSRFAADGVL